MGPRFGLGPVFAFEWLVQSRRWQVYALRSLFGLGLLAAMAFVWAFNRHAAALTSMNAYARVGEVLFVGLSGMEIALVLMAAPAATAGAICLDKQRGTLAHLLVTDLSDAEIVLGKLAARLVPAAGVLLSSLAVFSMAMLLGGIDPRALMAAFLISLGVAVLGCTLALAISVWASKTHEVLLATYAVIVAWLMAIPLARGLGFAGERGSWSGPDWLEASNPFFLAFHPYLYPGSENLRGGAGFFGGCLAISAALTALAVWTLRPVAANPRAPKARAKGPAVSRRRSWARWLPGPSLDGNPVLWREWHRTRPSRITGMVWVVYLGVYGVFAVAAVVIIFTGGPSGQHLGIWANGFGASIGLLLVSLSAATSLAEERVRGSLDVLLATPLSTAEIVRGKWWGSTRNAFAPGALMMLIATGLALNSGIWYGPIVLLAYYAGLSAMISSIGLAAATFIRRPGRAVAATVAAYLGLTIGVLFLVMASGHAGDDSFPGHASPFFAFVIASASTSQFPSPGRWALLGAMPFWTVVWFGVAGVLLLVTLRGFDRRLGRTPEAGQPPRPAPLLKWRVSSPRLSEL